MHRPRLLDPGPGGIKAELCRMGVDPAGISIMEAKGSHLLIRLDDLDIRAALILKQDMLSVGGDAALRREAAGLKVTSTPVLLMGTQRQLGRLIEKLANQPFGLTKLAEPLTALLRNIAIQPRFVVKDRDLLKEGKTLVMGILNITEDSFFDGGRFYDRDAAVARGLEMVDQGADIIDVGGESTRPGAKPVNEELETGRILPVIRELSTRGVRNISVDTTKASVAEKALKEGASIINDISGMNFEPEIRKLVSENGASVILMHTRGRPETMQKDVQYDDLLGEICTFLERSLDEAIQAGVRPEMVCLDPGIGFGKLPEQNLELIARLREIRSMGTAVMVGVSRKSFIGHFSGATVKERLPGSLAAMEAAVSRGADIVRVHDVAETVQALAVTKGIRVMAPC
jgi:dihydropteroate synthase